MKTDSSILKNVEPSIKPLFLKLTGIIDDSEKKSKSAQKVRQRQRYLEISLKAIQIYGSLYSQYKLENLQLQIDELKESIKQKERNKKWIIKSN